VRHGQSSVWSRVGGCPIWILELYIKIQTLAEALLDEQGQNLVEYGLLLVLIALAAAASVRGVATAIGSVFTRVGTKLGTYTS
jgi:pilus assembly protein Flp/PilA